MNDYVCVECFWRGRYPEEVSHIERVEFWGSVTPVTVEEYVCPDCGGELEEAPVCATEDCPGEPEEGSEYCESCNERFDAEDRAYRDALEEFNEVQL